MLTLPYSRIRSPALLSRRITRVPRRLELGFALGSAGGGLGRGLRRGCQSGGGPFGLFRGGLLRLGRLALLRGRPALGGELLVDRGPGAELVERLLLRLGGLAGAV